MKVVASWSGGKDSAYAVQLAKQQGHEIVNLLTMMSGEEKSKFHMISSELLNAQASAIEIPLIKKQTTNEMYEQNFKDSLIELKTKGVEGLVTGDICTVANHEEDWLKRICQETGLKPIRPLWMMDDTKQIYHNYVETGFKATVVRINVSKLGIEWLGRELDRQFYGDIIKQDNIDPCGEGGEYHTIVTDGPYFKKKIIILETEKHYLENNFGYLEIKNFILKNKKDEGLNV